MAHGDVVYDHIYIIIFLFTLNDSIFYKCMHVCVYIRVYVYMYVFQEETRNANSLQLEVLRYEGTIRSLTGQISSLSRERDFAVQSKSVLQQNLHGPLGIAHELDDLRNRVARDIQCNMSRYDKDLFARMISIESLLSVKTSEMSDVELHIASLEDRIEDATKQVNDAKLALSAIKSG